MYFIIYKITNKINNKYYIGKHQTKNLNDGYMGSGKLIMFAIKKYGIENFTKEILHIFSAEEEMNAKEKELVIISEETYNLCEGGHGGNSFLNEEIRNKAIQNSNKKRKILLANSEWIIASTEKAKNTMYAKYGKNAYNTFGGKIHTEESKKKISKSNSCNHMGDKNPQYGKCWITNGIINKMVKKEDIDTWVLLGYIKGRI